MNVAVDHRPLQLRSEGAVYLEYLVSAVPMFIMFLTLVQLGIVYTAGIAVKHAANSAVRAAVVILPDADHDYTGDPVARYAGTTPFDLATGRIIVQPQTDPVMRMMQGLTLGGGAKFYDSPTSPENPRMQNIRAAAIQKTLAISPILNRIRAHTGLSVRNAFDPGKGGAGNSGREIDDIGHMANYASLATFVAVQCTPAPCTAGRNVTVTVHYVFRCGIPVADFIVCPDGQLWDPGTAVPAASSQMGGAFRTVTGLGGRSRILRAEATLRIPSELYVPGEEP